MTSALLRAALHHLRAGRGVIWIAPNEITVVDDEAKSTYNVGEYGQIITRDYFKYEHWREQNDEAPGWSTARAVRLRHMRECARRAREERMRQCERTKSRT